VNGGDWTTVDEGEHWKIRREEELQKGRKKGKYLWKLHIIRRLPHHSLL
jgi:hypothetical protein